MVVENFQSLLNRAAHLHSGLVAPLAADLEHAQPLSYTADTATNALRLTPTCCRSIAAGTASTLHF
jgi:hypothetical protein